LPDVVSVESASRSSTGVRRLLGEPLLHFAVLGALVFLANRALNRSTNDHVLEVSASKQREMAKLFEQRQGRAPTREEEQQLIRRYVEDEVLFREGERLALLQSDPLLRAQLVGRVRSLLQAEVTAKPPTDAELERFFQQHRATFVTPETITYREHWFRTGPDARDDARRLALSLQRGEEPEALGSVTYTRRSRAELVAVHGADLTSRIWSLPLGTWRELSSSRGIHVVRVDERVPSNEPSLASVRERVKAEYVKTQTARAFEAEVERLTSMWQVRVAAQP
jgi:PPIC-type PPIASE domain